MPYAPQATYKGGDYIMAGIGQAAAGISKGITGLIQDHQENDYLDGAGQLYFANDPDKYNKFRQGSVGTKRGMITGLQAQQAQAQQQHQQNMQDWLHTDQSTRDWAQIGNQQDQRDMTNWQATDNSQRQWQALNQKEEPWTPSADQMKQASDAGYLYLPQSPRSGTFVPNKNNGNATPPPALGSDPTGTGNFYFDGAHLKPVPTTALPSDAQQRIDTLSGTAQNLQGQIDQRQKEIDSGNLYPGWDWLKKVTGGDSFADQQNQLAAKRAATLTQIQQLRQQSTRTPMVAPTSPIAAPAVAPAALPPGVSGGVVSPTPPSGAPPAAAAPKFTPGAVYKDGKGNRATYNPDGSWTPLSQTTQAPAAAPADQSGAADDQGDPNAEPITPAQMMAKQRAGLIAKPTTRPPAGMDVPAAVGDDTTSYIKGFEGPFQPRAYADGAQTSIGYGTRARSASETLTEPQASQRLNDELSQSASRIDSAANARRIALSPDQRTALISYDYNTGKGVDAIRGSGGNLHAIAQAIAHGPITQNGKVLDGLIKRRVSEASLFMGGGAGSVAAR